MTSGAPRRLTRKAAGLVFLAIVPFLSVLGGEPVLDDEFLWRHPVTTGEKPWWEAFTSPFLEGKLRVAGESNPYYRPVTLLLFRAEHELAGDSMLLAHATNIALHAANAVLLWLFLARHLSPGRAWLAAALFALHPVHAESVAWVSGRTDVLSLVFVLAAALLLPRRPVAAASAFLAAILAKETAVFLPLALLPFVDGTVVARLRRVAPLVAALLVYALLRAALYPLVSVEAGIRPLSALPVAPVVLGTYLRMLVFPFPLGFQRAIPLEGSPVREEFLPGLALLLASVVLFARSREARPHLLWLFVFLLPASGVFPVLPYEPGVWPFGERFLYIPSVGLAGLAGALLPTARVLWVPLLAASAGLAAWHATHFRSTLGLVESSLRWFPGSASLWMIRGEGALHRSLQDTEKGAPAAGRLAGARAAISDLERALLIRPGWYRARRTLAQALASAEETTRSEALFRELLAENQQDPLPPSNLAVLLLQSGRRKEARELLLEALRRQPDFGPAKTNLEWLDAGR